MKVEKWKKAVITGVGAGILIFLPLWGEIYHKTPYYIGIILLIPLAVGRIMWNEKFEERFYTSWGKAREQGFKINLVRESAKGAALIAVLVIINQYFGLGFTPIEIVSQLSKGILTWLILMLLGFGLIYGIAAWYEKEKRYCRIYFEMKKNRKISVNRGET